MGPLWRNSRGGKESRKYVEKYQGTLMYMLIHAYFLIHLLPRLAPDENFQSLATQGARAVIFVGQQICRQIADDALRGQ